MSPVAPDLQARALALFTRCLEQPETDRQRWLMEQCAEQPELMTAVVGLLKADQKAGDFLEAPALTSSARTSQDRSGERVGAFELLEEVGAGGMGRVYRARRADGSFEQEVAVKLFEAGHFDGPFLERFHAERQILASLEHPGIARLIDGGDTDDGTPFVVMELIRGQPIAQYCAEQSLNFTARLQLFQRVCEALDTAHQRGIVHRDIKSGNVLVGQDGQPKVIDFGIAKVLSPESLSGVADVALPKTATQHQVLTPEYASPEQVRGQPVGPSGDVYSLGVLLYEILTGTRPYQISTRSPVEIERTVCDSIPADPSDLVARRKAAPPPGLQGADALRRQLRGDVDRIVMTALRKEPEQRYSTAAAMSKDIERYLSGQPVAARGASHWYRLGKFVQRNRAATVATLAIFGILVAALIVVAMQVKQARLEAARAEAAKDFLIEMISQADPYENTEQPTMAGAVRQAIPGIEIRFADQPELKAEMHYAVGFAMTGLGELPLAAEQINKALDYYQQHGDAPQQARALTALGRVNWDESRYELAEQRFREAIALVDQDSSAAGRRAYYDALSDLGGLLPKVDRFEEAGQLTQQALDMIPSLTGVSKLNQAILWNNLAVAREGVEDFDGAIQAYETSIAMHREYSDAHPDLATALGNLGLTYEVVGDMDRAVDTVRQAVAMQRELLGPEHPQYLLMLYNLGSLQVNAGDLESAVENLAEAVRLAPQAYAENHLYTGRFNHRIAEVYWSLEDAPQARRYALAAQAIYQAREDIPERWIAALDELLATIPAP